MADIRGASLAAHAAARATGKGSAARHAARSAGQAVATAHVAQHAFGAAYYALKAVGATGPAGAEVNVAREWDWQVRHAPRNLREEITKTMLIQKRGNRVSVRVCYKKDIRGSISANRRSAIHRIRGP